MRRRCSPVRRRSDDALRRRLRLLAGERRIALGAPCRSVRSGARSIHSARIRRRPQDAPKASRPIPDSVSRRAARRRPSRAAPQAAKPKPVARPSRQRRPADTATATPATPRRPRRRAATRRRRRAVRRPPRRRRQRRWSRPRRTGARSISPLAPSSAATISPRSRSRPERVEEQDDVKAMTLLGELYANGFGVDAGRRQGGRVVPARRRSRRPRGDVRARDDAHGRPRRHRSIARRRPSCSPPPPSSTIRWRPTISACSISKASCSRRISRAPPNCSASPPTPAARRRNTRSPRSTRKAAACRRTSSKPHALLAPRRDRRQHRRAGRIRHRAVQRHRRRQGRGRAPPASCSAPPQGQPDRAEPARPSPGGRARPAGRSGRGDQVAPDLQGRRRQRRRTSTTSCAARSRRPSPPPRRRRSPRIDAHPASPASRGLDAAAAAQTDAPDPTARACSAPPSSTS